MKDAKGNIHMKTERIQVEEDEEEEEDSANEDDQVSEDEGMEVGCIEDFQMDGTLYCYP